MRLEKISNGKDIVIMASHDISSAEEIYNMVDMDFTMYVLVYDDWNSDFSPWKNGEFSGGGRPFLENSLKDSQGNKMAVNTLPHYIKYEGESKLHTGIS